MRGLERATIEEIGLPGVVLMDTAGRAAAASVARVAPVGQVVVVCGPGNNGGDGFVVARVLAEAGRAVVTLLAAPRGAIRGDAATELAALERAGGVIRAAATAGELEAAGAMFGEAAVVVDAVFGLGQTRTVEGHYAAVVAAIERAPGVVVAIDVPTGIESDTGRVLGVAVTADVTVTFGALKVAVVSAPGFLHAGQVEVAGIGIPRRLIDASAVGACLWEEADARAVVPRPQAGEHKGTRGHVVCVA